MNIKKKKTSKWVGKLSKFYINNLIFKLFKIWWIYDYFKFINNYNIINFMLSNKKKSYCYIIDSSNSVYFSSSSNSIYFGDSSISTDDVDVE